MPSPFIGGVGRHSLAYLLPVALLLLGAPITVFELLPLGLLLAVVLPVLDVVDGLVVDDELDADELFADELDADELDDGALDAVLDDAGGVVDAVAELEPFCAVLEPL